VVTHLGVGDWIRADLPAGLDAVGPVASAVLERTGLFYPANTHIVVPMLDHARGGTIVFGIGGDELFALWTLRRLADIAAGRTRARRDDLRTFAGACLPARARLARRPRGSIDPPIPWLRPEAQARLGREIAEEEAYDTRRWDRHVRRVPHLRYLAVAMRHMRRITATVDARSETPFLDPALCESLARAGGWRGFGGRTATLRALFSELLPDDVLARTDKATFGKAYFTDETQRFAAEWSGKGLDDELVDAQVVREVWMRPEFDFRSALLLQSAWLHDRNGPVS
jgi:asparagine synthase (glutamine-hydrolysing)